MEDHSPTVAAPIRAPDWHSCEECGCSEEAIPERCPLWDCCDWADAVDAWALTQDGKHGET